MAKMEKLEKIRKAFAKYFAGENIELPEEIEKKGKILQGRWNIIYVLLTDDDGKPALEFVANHRHTDPAHLLIKEDGTLVALDAIQESYSYNAEIEGDKERAEKEWREHNERVVKEMEKKGLI